jgi:prevent-host-death family protein
MKSISAAEARQNLEAVLDSAQTERVVVVRGGKPSAVIVGIEDYDAEDLALAKSPRFWRLIESRRSGKEISLSDLKARLRSGKRPSRKAAERK